MKTEEDYLNLMQGTPPPGGEVSAVMGAASYVQPDQAVELRRRAEQTGVPFQVLQRAGAAVPPPKPQVDYTQLMQEAPKTAAWLLDPANAAVAQDDVETLRDLEKTTQQIGPFKRAVQITTDPIRAAAAGIWAAPGMAAEGFGNLAGAAARSQQRFFKNVVGVDLPYRLFDPLNSEAILKWVGGAPKQFAEDVIAPPKERENYVTSVFGGAGQMVAQGAMMLAAPQAALPTFFAMGADQMGEEAEAVGKYGEAGSDTAMVLGGAFTAVTEKLAIQNILNRLPPKIKRRAFRYAADLSLAVGFEAVQEGAEQVWQNLLVQSLIDEQRELLDGVVEGAAVGGGAAGLVRGLLLGLAPGRLKYNEKTNAAADALRETQTLERAVDLTSASNLAQRSPEAFDQLVGTFTAQGIDQIGIPLEVVRSYAQTKGMPGAQLAQELGVSQASFVEAEMTGGDLRVPTATFLRSTHAASLSKDARTRATGMTANEANAWANTEAGEELRQLLEETKTQLDSSKDSSIKVYDDLYLKFKAAGRSESQAQMLALVGSRQARAMATRFKTDTWEWYSANPIEIGTTELGTEEQVKKTFEQFAGTKAVGANLQNLERAKQMKQEGALDADTWSSTGWHQGVDGKWRFEIPDSGADFKSDFAQMEESQLFGETKTVRLGDLLDHPALFAAYPEAADIQVVKRKGLFDFGGLQGWFDGKNTIGLTPYAQHPLSTLLHEVQHWIQTKEGFARGGNENSVFDALSVEQKTELADNLLKAQTIKAEQAAKDIAGARELFEKYGDKRDELKTGPWEGRDAFEEEAKKVGVSTTIINAFLYGTRTEAELIKASELDIASAGKNIAAIRRGDQKEIARLLSASGEMYTFYKALAGEVEARNVQKRRDMPLEELLRSSPENTQDVDRGAQIVITEETAAGSTLPDFSVDRTFFQRTDPVVGEVVGGFYSDLERKLSTLLPKKGTAAQYKEVVENLIKAQKIKKEEAMDTGLLAMLDATSNAERYPTTSQTVYEREDIIQSWVAEERPNVVVSSMSQKDAGGTVYRVLDTVYGESREFESREEAEKYLESWQAEDPAALLMIEPQALEATGYFEMVLPGVSTDYREWTLSFGKDTRMSGRFTEMHFGPPNTFAHIRTDQRETFDSKPVLFINELQSDWASAGAKRGFVGDPPIDTKNWTAEQKGTSLSGIPSWQVTYSKNRSMPMSASSAEMAIRKVAAALERQRVPRPPKFVQSWQNYALRQMLKHAIDSGMEYMAWPATAEQVQQIEQWGDSYTNDRVVRNYTSDIPKALNNYLGRFGVKTEQLQMPELNVMTSDIQFDPQGRTGLSNVRHQGSPTRYFVQQIGPARYDVLGPVEELYAEGTQNLTYLEVQSYVASKLSTVKTFVNAVRITPEMRQVLSQGQPYYQKIEDVKRGVSQFGSQGERYMGLLKDANRSTAIHEFGHIWLEELRTLAARKDAPQDLKDDWKTIKKWLGIKSGMPSREQHELFARATERYFMEGNAPSTALRRVFRSFKRWLIDIYRHVNALGAPINDDVRGVFDRLLATQDEIKEAREDTEQRPLFTTAKEMGISQELFDTYAKAVRDVVDEQEEKLAAEAMEDVTRETKDWWKEQSAALREQVADSLSKSKLYGAVNWLRTGKLPDGTELNIPAARLEASTIKDPEALVRLRRMGVVASKEGSGINVEDAAPLFGYANGDELLAALETAVPFKQAVQQAVDAEMRARHGDFMANLDERADQALKAVHDDASGALLRAEVAALHRLHRQSAGARRVVREEERAEAKEKLAEKDEKIAALRNSLDQARKEGRYNLRWAKAEENQRLQQERQEAEGAMDLPPLSAFRSMARGMVSQQRVRDLNPLAYLQAERKAGKAAYKAALNKQYQVAATAKMRQLLNHYLYLEAVKAQDVTNGMLKRFQRLQKKSAQERWGKAGGRYLEVLNDLMEQYEFVKVSNKNLTRRENLRAWLVQQEAEGATITIPGSVLDEVRRTNYRELTLDNLRDIDTTITSLEHQVRLKSKLLQGRQQADYESTVEELIRSLTENFNVDRPPPIDEQTLTRMDRIRRGLQNADSTLLKTEQLLRWLDGDQPAGVWFRTIFEPIARAQDAELDTLTDFGDTFANLFERYYDGQGRERLLAVEQLPELGGVKLTRQALISMALNTGTESNYQKLKEGYDWTDPQIAQALSRLTEADWKFVQEVWDMLESMWPQIAGLEKRLTGLEPKRMERRTVQTAFGTMRGGYYPVVYSPDQPGTSKVEADSLFGPNYVRATTDQGHTKERTSFVGKIQLNLEVIPRHMASVVHDITHREAVININRLLGDKRIQSAIANRLGSPYIGMLNGWLRNVANDRSMDPTGNSWWLKYAAKLRINASVVAMGFKATTMLAQLSGVVQAVEQVKIRHFTSAMYEFLASPIESAKAVRQLSGEMRNRNQSLERDIRDVYNAQLGKTGFISAVHRNAFKGIAIFDAFVTVPTWKAAFADAKDRKLSDEDAIMWADSVVRLTASAGGAKDQAAVQRANEFMKWGTLFYSYFSVLYARLRSLGHVNKVGAEKYATIAWRSLLVWMVPAVLGELLAFRGPDEEEEEGAAEWAFKKVALYPVMTLPFVRDLGATFDFGFESRTPLGALFNGIYRSATGVGPALEGEREFIDLFKPAMSSAGYIVGLPAAQINITAEYLWDIYTGEEDPESVSEFIRNLLIRREE